MLDLSGLGQLFNIGLQGLELQPSEKKFIVENNIGGVSLFARNLHNRDQIKNLCQSLQALHLQQASKKPLFIGIDMEGGRVNRLPPPFRQWPSAAHMAQQGADYITECMLAMGEELSSMGINLNFAPCADVHSNPDNPIIGDRAFSSQADKAGRLALQAARALHTEKVFSCAKHFPGHGNTQLDSHLELPVEQASLSQLSQRELKAFAPLIDWPVPFVMTAHILYKGVDVQWPATLSNVFLNQLLRRELQYTGLVITDDMGMKAIAARWSVEKAALRALHAGADVLLYCNDFKAPQQALDCVRRELQEDEKLCRQVQQKITRVLQTKTKYSTFFKT